MTLSHDSCEQTSLPIEQQLELIPKEIEPQDDKAKWSPLFTKFVDTMNAFPTPEEKIAHGLQFMRGSISQEGSPRFREFWDSRRLVLPFFRENLNVAIRSKLWDEYVDLTVEARKLKEILEEQSSFAMEQIDLAIQAIEVDVSGIDNLLAAAEELSFPQLTQRIQQKLSTYSQLQRELNILNQIASRLNSLRKETIKTDMRIRFKTKFFKRLSELGDKVFPKRKALIEQVSGEFSQDVQQFIAEHFSGEAVGGAPYYVLREEIKALQGMAKILTLNSTVFNQTRLSLSECWDKVKVLEKEHKKAIVERRQNSSGVSAHIQSKIDELKAKSAEISLIDLDREIEEISNEMRAVFLDRDDIRSLRDELAAVRAPHVAAQEQKMREQEAAEKEKIRLKKERVSQLKEKIALALKDGPGMEIEALGQLLAELSQEMGQVDVSKIEKQQMERQLRKLRDLVSDRKELSMLNLSDDDRKNLDSLKTVLAQKKERRAEIKVHIEGYRKMLGASNLDFEKAMLYRDHLEQEKELLEKANAGIEEVESKIAALEA